MIMQLKCILISQMYLLCFPQAHIVPFGSKKPLCLLNQRSHGYIKEILAEELLTAVSYITLHPVARKLILGD